MITRRMNDNQTEWIKMKLNQKGQSALYMETSH